MPRRIALLVAALLVAAASPTARAAAPAGGLTQLAGSAGCLLGPAQARSLRRTGCAAARGMGSTQHLVLSADGRFAYAIGNDTWSVGSFRRDPMSGRLTQLPGAAGCLAAVERPATGCGTARGLVWAFSLALSPDGRSLYVTAGSGNGVAVLARDAATGILAQDPGPAGCLRNRTGGDGRGGPSPEASGCTLVDGLSYPRGIQVSPDGRFVVIAAFDGRSITSFARDPTTGTLAPVATPCAAGGACPAATARHAGPTRPFPAACARADVCPATTGRHTGPTGPYAAACAGPRTPCVAAPGLRGVTDLRLTADGRFLYASALTDSAVSAFARDPDSGALTPIGCLTAGGGPADPAPAPAARASQDGPAAGCTPARALDGAYDLTLSPDDAQVLVAARHARAIAILRRDATTGALTQAAGAAGCVADAGAEGCATGRGLRGARAVAVSPDGRSAYAGAFDAGTVSAFRRAPATGALSQLPGRAGCASVRTSRTATRTPGCTPARAVRQAWAVVVSPDGRHVYTGVGGDGNSGLAAFRRTAR